MDERIYKRIQIVWVVSINFIGSFVTGLVGFHWPAIEVAPNSVRIEVNDGSLKSNPSIAGMTRVADIISGIDTLKGATWVDVEVAQNMDYRTHTTFVEEVS